MASTASASPTVPEMIMKGMSISVSFSTASAAKALNCGIE
jgi:hypothetical protein